jgi:hypothetical protein
MIKDTDLFGTTYYLQPDKINGQEKETLGGTVESETSLGKVVTWLGLDAKISVDLTKEKATSNEVIKELSFENKLLIALNALERKGECCDLNEMLGQYKEPKKYVYFEGGANFSPIKENTELFLVGGIVEDYKFRSFCSKEFIFSNSIRYYLSTLSDEKGTDEEGVLKVFCVGFIMFSREKNLDLTLYYIGGL